MKIPKNYRPILYNAQDIDEYIEGMIKERRSKAALKSKKTRIRLSQEQRDEIEELHEKGFTVREIVKRTGVNKSTVGRIVKS